jgi:flagellin
MAINSVNTNIGAMVALQSLTRTNEEMQAVQKRISTGFRVADAKDDGAAFAVAQRVRGDVAGLTTANEQLGSAKGLLNTTLGALGEVSKAMQDIRKVLTNLSSDTISDSDRASYTQDFENLVNQMNRALGDASYNGRTLLGSQDANQSTSSAAETKSVVRNETGSTLDITGVDATALTFDTRVATRGRDVSGTFTQPDAFALTATMSSATARAMLGNGDQSGGVGTPLAGVVAAKNDGVVFGGATTVNVTGPGQVPVLDGNGNPTFDGNGAPITEPGTITTAVPVDSTIKTFATVEAAVNSALAKFGADARAIDSGISTNRAKIDALDAGLGALVDADLAKESARLQALQIRQQLGTQSLSIANQAPQALLSLFR